MRLERRKTADRTAMFRGGGGTVMVTPISPDYWSYRVRLTPKQSVIGFPKFSTIGIGFAHETDWNTNLPYQCTAEEIFEHIKHNAGDPDITRDQIIDAIRLIQRAATEDRR